MTTTERADHFRKADSLIKEAIAEIFAAKPTPQQWHVVRMDVSRLREIRANLEEYADSIEWADVDEKAS